MSSPGQPFLLKGGLVVTQNKHRDVFSGDVLISDSKIKKIARSISAPAGATIVNCHNKFVIPGLIQVHTHLCQALFRGLADDLPLLDWLKEKIWPFEAAHNKKSIRASAQIGLLEMSLLGTTSVLDMASVNHTHEVMDEAENSKVRYWGGKCLMDLKKYSGPLYQSTKEALSEMEDLISFWHNKNSLIQYAICPRFAVSCSDSILRSCQELQSDKGLLLHTHASENLDEVALIKKRTGLSNIDYLSKQKILNVSTVIAHGVHMSTSEVKKMIKHQTGLAHCPSSNLKLASGFAPIQKYLNMGLDKIGLGSDGAPCNNTMDPFLEMRLAALLQKPLFGSVALSAEKAFDLATYGGAKVLNSQTRIGSLEEGKLADVVTVDRSHPSVATVDNPYSALVYSCSGRDVKDVFINGRAIVKDGEHQIYDRQKVIKNAKEQLRLLLRRVN